MITLFTAFVVTILAMPVLFVVLCLWAAFALVVGIIKLIGWSIRVSFELLGWLLIGSLVLAVLDVPLIAIFAALIIIACCSHAAHATA